mmetsp:Transcript_18710/g.43044  ORF Transcript_18710/g.43044 Transcript_18710/m.43044 type:complete len:264 (+) Transcript_18710:847-1638(+)
MFVATPGEHRTVRGKTCRVRVRSERRNDGSHVVAFLNALGLEQVSAVRVPKAAPLSSPEAPHAAVDVLHYRVVPTGADRSGAHAGVAGVSKRTQLGGSIKLRAVTVTQRPGSAEERPTVSDTPHFTFVSQGERVVQPTAEGLDVHLTQCVHLGRNGRLCPRAAEAELARAFESPGEHIARCAQSRRVVLATRDLYDLHVLQPFDCYRDLTVLGVAHAKLVVLASPTHVECPALRSSGRRERAQKSTPTAESMRRAARERRQHG